MNARMGVHELLQTAPRLSEIAGVLAAHGFLDALRGQRHWPPPVAVRAAFEQLGLVFLKFGQVLGMRRDLLPEAYADELERLQDRLTPVPFDEVRATIEGELRAPLEQLYASFEAEPRAAATIAQVHEATLHDGRRVAVKVRRPNIQAIIAADIAALSYVASLLEAVSRRLEALDVSGMIRQFHESLRRESDFRLEARNIRRFREALADEAGIWIPDVVADRSGEAVLTMEYSPGLRVDRYAAEHPDSTRQLADSLAALMLRSIFERGVFQADPHPGNVFVLPDGRLCLHDFGMVGELDERTRASLTGLLAAAVDNDPRAATEAYLEVGTSSAAAADRAALEADVGALLRDIHGRPLADISVGNALFLLLRIGGRHGARGRGAFLLLARAFAITEALLRQIDPQINVIDVFRRELTEITAKRYSPERMLKDTRRLAAEIDRLVRDAPADARRLLHRLAEGDLGQVSSPGVESVGERLCRDVERLTGAVVSATLVNAATLVVAPRKAERSLLGGALLAVGLLGTALAAAGAWRQARE